MSLSVHREDRVPNPEAVWMVAHALGFTGKLDEWITYLEDLEGHGKAVNAVQLVTAPAAHA